MRDKHGLKIKFDGGRSQTVWFKDRDQRDGEYDRLKKDPKVIYVRKVERS